MTLVFFEMRAVANTPQRWMSERRFSIIPDHKDTAYWNRDRGLMLYSTVTGPVKLATSVSRKARSGREFLRGLVHTAHPLLVQIIPIRRCNIDCGYCNEYDKVSAPVPAGVMKARIDHLASLGTAVVALSGGEPMLPPDLDDLIRHIRHRGMMAGLITNGYFLVPKRIDELNSAGLDFLQISIDNLEPDEVSKKSLRLLDRKLLHLKEHAIFDININS